MGGGYDHVLQTLQGGPEFVVMPLLSHLSWNGQCETVCLQWTPGPCPCSSVQWRWSKISLWTRP